MNSQMLSLNFAGRSGVFRWGALLAVSLAAASIAAARDKTSPDEWLQRMSVAIQTMDYTGTVIRQSNGEVQPLKVVHKKINGVINEKIVIQEGNGLEIIRIGDEVHCILPDRKTVLIERWENASSQFAILPSSNVDPGAQYDVLILKVDQRVAGRSAVNIAIRPNDSFRFERRFWLDEKTGFPLRTELIDQNGVVVDQLKFADIELGAVIAEQSLIPSVSLESFVWYANPANEAREQVESEWISDGLPAGFRILSTRNETLAGSDKPVMHVLVGDGMATVSVFISAMQGADILQSSARGSSHSFSTEKDGYRVTAVGEVPPQTVRTIAMSMHRPGTTAN